MLEHMFDIVNVRQAQALVARGVQVIDVRDHAEWARNHIPGARLMSIAKLRASPIDVSKGVLFVCARGLRSQTAARVAIELGANKVYSLAGGTHAWEHEGLPMTCELSVAV